MTDYNLTHLKQLEAESIHIIREVAAEFERPVMLYSIGKDSAVMLHLARKAFYPAPPPFPLLHVDTTWKFREMIQFRDQRAAELGLDLIVHVDGRREWKDVEHLAALGDHDPEVPEGPQRPFVVPNGEGAANRPLVLARRHEDRLRRQLL